MSVCRCRGRPIPPVFLRKRLRAESHQVRSVLVCRPFCLIAVCVQPANERTATAAGQAGYNNPNDIRVEAADCERYRLGFTRERPTVGANSALGRAVPKPMVIGDRGAARLCLCRHAAVIGNYRSRPSLFAVHAYLLHQGRWPCRCCDWRHSASTSRLDTSN